MSKKKPCCRGAGTDEVLGEALLLVGPEDVPDDVAAQGASAAGLRAWRQGDPANAGQWLEHVPDTSVLRLWALYLIGRQQRSERLFKSAILTQRDVMMLQPAILATTFDRHRIELLKDLSLQEVAGIYEEIVRLEEALNYASLTNSDSPIFSEAMGHAAMVALQDADRDGAEAFVASADKRGYTRFSAQLEGVRVVLASDAGCKQAGKTVARSRYALEVMGAKLDAVADVADARALGRGMDLRILLSPDIQAVYDTARIAGEEAQRAGELGLPEAEMLDVHQAARTEEARDVLDASVARAVGEIDDALALIDAVEGTLECP